MGETGRVARAEELERLRRQNEVILDNAGDGIYVLEPAGQVAFANPAAARMVGWEVEEMVGRPQHETVHHSRADGTPYPSEECPIHETLQDGAFRRVSDEVFWRKDGTSFPVEYTAAAIRQEGEASGAVVTFQDVTDRVRAEEALKESEERFRLLVENVEDHAIFMLSPEGRVVSWNSGAASIFGYEEEEAIGRHSSFVFVPEDVEAGAAEHELEVALSEGRAEDERWHVRKDGTRFFASGAAEPVRDGDGGLRGFAKVARDITERKRDQEVLKESEHWLHLAQEAASAGTWEWDLKGGDVRWSREHCVLFGFDTEERVTREKWLSVVHPDDVGRIEEAWQACAAGEEEEVRTEYRADRDGETWWAEAHGRTVRDAAGQPARVLGITIDVTDRKRAEEERDRLLARETAARAEAEERKRIGRELHDRVAHLMAVVRQSLELYRAFEGREPQRAAEKLELAERVTAEAMASVRDLSRVLGSTEAADGLCPALSGLLREYVPRDVDSDLVVEGDESLVGPGVRDQLFLILREAVRNAAAHSGASTINVRLTITDEETVGVVEDDGQGVDPKEVQRSRTGGLSFMRDRAALIGGECRIGPAPQRGTRVEVTVPLGTDPDAGQP